MKDDLITAAAAMGRRGGLVRVKKGLASLTEERRREIAMQGVEARRKKRAEGRAGEYRACPACGVIEGMKVDVQLSAAPQECHEWFVRCVCGFEGPRILSDLPGASQMAIDAWNAMVVPPGSVEFKIVAE